MLALITQINHERAGRLPTRNTKIFATHIAFETFVVVRVVPSPIFVAPRAFVIDVLAIRTEPIAAVSVEIAFL
jgi:hypothetical protein